jgi:teichuronic acid biosynthesis protein TuaE
MDMGTVMDIKNSMRYGIYFILFLLGFLGIFNPLFYGGVIVLSIILLLWNVDLIRLKTILWYLIVVSMFYGAYLSIPGHESLYLFRFLLPVYIIVFLMIGKLDFQAIQQYRIPLLALAVFVLLSLFSYFYAEYPAAVFRSSYFAFEILFIFLVVFQMLSKKSITSVLWIVAIAYFCNLAVGVVEILAGVHLNLSSANIYISTTIKYQPTGFYFNTNDYALYISLYYPLVILTIQRIKRELYRHVAYLVITLVSVFVVVSSYSRIGMLCMGISALTLFFILYRKKAVLALVVVGPPAGILFSLTNFGNNFLEIVFNSFENKDNSTSARAELYDYLWKISKDSRFLGIGAGGAPKKLNSLFLGFENTGTGVSVTGHNFFLETLANLGLLGFLCMIVLLAYLVVKIIKSFWLMISARADGEDRISLSVAFLVAMTFFGATIALSTTLEKRFLWFGLAIAYYLIRHTNAAELEVGRL